MNSLVYFGERNEAAPYLCDRGWELAISSVHDLFAANGFPPFNADDAQVGDMCFVSGTFDHSAK